MTRCIKCILPKNYPGISFNSSGVCKYCNDFKKPIYIGSNNLKNDIREIKNNNKSEYDCVIGYSGGRDSSYLLYYLTKKLNLNVLACFNDNGFIPEQTKKNMEYAIDVLKVKLIIKKHQFLKDCFHHHINSWMKKPSLATIETLCIGCRYGIYNGLNEVAKKYNVPVVITGANPHELALYRYNLMKFNPEKDGHIQFLLGIAFNIIKNPRILYHTKSLNIQLREYIRYFELFEQLKQKFHINSDITWLYPFSKYIQWDEKEINNTVETKLDWKKNPYTKSSWRGDCDIALLKFYIYNKLIGFNDKCDFLSSLIRHNQISRKIALNRLEKEVDITEDVVKKIFKEQGLNYNSFVFALETLKNKMN